MSRMVDVTESCKDIFFRLKHVFSKSVDQISFEGRQCRFEFQLTLYEGNPSSDVQTCCSLSAIAID